MKTSALLILLVIFLALLGLLLWLFPLDRNEGLTACTLEALVCPDGSGVGRSGPACTFEACPNQDSFVGTLRQEGGNTHLIIAAPEDVPRAATYALPLELRVSNALGGLLDTRVRVFGSFVEGNILQVESMESLEGMLGDPAYGEVRVGETTLVSGVKITLHEVVQDSRCPSDAECIEGGGITARVTLLSDTDMETRNMASDEAPYPFDAYQISIESIAPSRLSGEEPAPGAYILGFRVIPL